MLTCTAFAIVFTDREHRRAPHGICEHRRWHIGLALSHAFEAAYVAQTIVRPIRDALQTGFNKVAQIGSSNADNSGEPAGWAKAMDFGRQTLQLGNLGPDGGQRVPAPRNVRGASDHAIACTELTTPMNQAGALWERQQHDDDGQSDDKI